MTVMNRPTQSVTVNHAIANRGIGTNLEEPLNQPTIPTPNRGMKRSAAPVISRRLRIDIDPLAQKPRCRLALTGVDRHDKGMINNQTGIIRETSRDRVRKR